MKRVAKIILFVFFCFIVLEAGVRVLGTYDLDGDFWLLGRHIKPYNYPIASIQSKIDNYLKYPDPYVVYDSNKGWTINASAQNESGLYTSNEIGIRGKWSPTAPDDNAIRIALFGDSFVHGDDVSDESTWAYYLNRDANKKQFVQVFNFGVGGYGIDQSYLRYLARASEIKPNIVIIGFQPENCFRNVNKNRIFYTKETGIPFFKPRFILVDHNTLVLVNQPTPAIEYIPAIIADYEEWSIDKHRFFYDPEDYRHQFWHFSKFFSVVQFIVESLQVDPENKLATNFSLSSEVGRICYEVTKKFATQAQADGARVIIMHIPFQAYFERTLEGKPNPYSELWSRLRSEFETIDIEPIIASESKKIPLDRIYIPHFSAEINQHIGSCLADYLFADNPASGQDWACPAV